MERAEHLRILEFGGLDEPGACDLHLEELAIEIVLPEIQEFRQNRESRRDVEFLPDVRLQEVTVVEHEVQDFRRRETVVPELQAKRHNMFPRLRDTASFIKTPLEKRASFICQ